MADQPRPGPPLKQYVAVAVESVMAEFEAGVYGKLEQRQKDDRLERCAAYARWRWQGYMAGTISSL